MSNRYSDVIWPSDPADLARWREHRIRLRMLSETWDQDLEDRLALQHGPIVRAVKGPRTMAKNLFRSLPEQLAVLYNESPYASHEEGAQALLGPGQYVESAGLWALMRQVQIHILGLRHSAVRVGWSDDREQLYYRHVTPDCIRAWSPPDNPGVPNRLHELGWYGKEHGWCWEVFDLRDASYRICKHDPSMEDDCGIDLRPEIEPELGAYPWVGRDGKPFIPIELYHAEAPTKMWDARKWRSLVDGALDLGVAATNFQHALLRAAHALKYGVNVHLRTPTTSGTGQDRHAVVGGDDPTAMVMFESEPSNPNATVGTFPQSVDPVAYMRALDMYERMISNVAGVDSAHLERSTDAWSGAALSINRDGKREAQKVYGPQQQRHDQALLGKSAKVVNIATGSSLPEDGYRVNYRAIPLSGGELREMREHNNEMIDRGRMSVVDAYVAEHPGITRGEAIAELRRIEADRKMLAGPTADDGQGDELGKPALALQQLALARERTLTIGDEQLATALGQSMNDLLGNLTRTIQEQS